MDIEASDDRSRPLCGPVEVPCYHDQGVIVGKEERLRTVVSYKAESNCDSIMMRLN